MTNEEVDRFMNYFTIGYCFASVAAFLWMVYMVKNHPHRFMEIALSDPLLIPLTLAVVIGISGLTTGTVFYLRSTSEE